MHIKKLSGAPGAEITGFDIREVNQKAAQQIYEAFLEHLILVFRNQDLIPDQQIKFNGYFVDVEVHLAKDHPLPDTGGKAVYVSQRFAVRIRAMSDYEPNAILGSLFRHQLNEKLIYRHKWCPSDTIMWDNRCATHHAYGGLPLGQIRHMHKTSLIRDATFFR